MKPSNIDRTRTQAAATRRGVVPVLIPEPRATIITSAHSRASFNNYYQCSFQGFMQQLLLVLMPGPRAPIITGAHSRASCTNYYQCSFKGLVQQLLPVLIPGPCAPIITSTHSRASFINYYQCSLRGPVQTFLSDGLFLCLRNEETVNQLRDNLLGLQISAAETSTT